MRQKTVLLFVLVVTVYALLLSLTGLDGISEVLSCFRVQYVPMILLLVAFSEAVTFLRWRYVLSRIVTGIPLKEGFLIYMSGLSVIAPAQSGELIRYYILKKIKGIPVKRSFPVHMVGIISDFICVVLMIIPPLLFIPGFGYIMTLTSVFVIILAFILGLSNRRVQILIRKIPILRSYADFGKSMKDVEKVADKRSMITIGALTALSWIAAISAFYFVLVALGVSPDPVSAMYIYGFSVLLGEVSTLPKGIAVTEGSILIMLFLKGMPYNIAAASSVMIRVFNMWLPMAAGIICLMALSRRMLSS
ncbi:MAG: hypothetical protein DRO99_04195 [Candidatus Aenigmatarchaeota archaeon]|nr:MAG: hypothetical protein DRO99_04195 [Candidatus Aenigmarchaeota archaeon]